MAKENHMYSFKKGLSSLPDLLVFTYPDQTSVCLWRVFVPANCKKERNSKLVTEVLQSGFGL